MVYRSLEWIRVVEPSPVFGFVSEDSIAWLRSVLRRDDLSPARPDTTREHSPSEMSPPFTRSTIVDPKKIFISRSGAKRRILNEFEIFTSLFEHLGFILLNPDTLSFSEQLRIFAGADVIAGEHGAAHTNVLFAPPGCLVIEIFQRREDASFYYLTQGVRTWQWIGIKTVQFEESGCMSGGMEETVVPIEPIHAVLRDKLDWGY